MLNELSPGRHLFAVSSPGARGRRLATRLARALAAATGESLTDAVRAALRDRLERQVRRGKSGIAAEIRRIQERLAQLPVLDKRSPEKIINYDKHGLPR